jgi:hypothetical protein
LWSVGVQFITPCEKMVRPMVSTASRSAARNSGVPGLAFFSATGRIFSSTMRAS